MTWLVQIKNKNQVRTGPWAITRAASFSTAPAKKGGSGRLQLNNTPPEFIIRCCIDEEILKKN